VKRENETGMAMSKEKILSEAMALNPREREAIAEELWLSVDEQTKEELAIAWTDEIRRRLDQAAKGEGSSKPVEKVLTRLRNKAKR
jgi:putative addiction module component (TIGR02574 family)